MAAEARETRRLLSGVSLLVRNAADAEQVASRVAHALDGAFPALCRVTVCRYTPQDHQLEIVAFWSDVPTSLGVGVRMSAAATTFPDVLVHDQPLVSGAGRRGLASQIAFSEGADEHVLIPLHRDGMIVGLLVVSSSRPQTFDADGSALFVEVGRVVEHRLLALAAL
jgi:hypothetical protein